MLLYHISLFSDDCLKDRLVSELYGMCTDLLILIEAETQEIALINVVVVEILCKLLLTSFIVFLTMPDFHLNDNLLSEIANNNICSR